MCTRMNGKVEKYYKIIYKIQFFCNKQVHAVSIHVFFFLKKYHLWCSTQKKEKTSVFFKSLHSWCPEKQNQRLKRFKNSFYSNNFLEHENFHLFTKICTEFKHANMFVAKKADFFELFYIFLSIFSFFWVQMSLGAKMSSPLLILMKSSCKS